MKSLGSSSSDDTVDAPAVLPGSRATAHWEKQLEYWTSKVAEYRDKTRHAERKRDEAIRELSPWQVGQVVEFCDRKGTWSRAIVRVLEPKGWGGCYVHISLPKKDGTWADRTQRVYTESNLRAIGATGVARVPTGDEVK